MNTPFECSLRSAPNGDPERSSTNTVRLTHARLPQWAPILVGVMALAAAGLPAMLLDWSPTAWVVSSLAAVPPRAPRLVARKSRTAAPRPTG